MKLRSHFIQNFVSVSTSTAMLISCGQQAAPGSRVQQIIGKDERTVQEFEGIPPVLSLTYKGEHICNGGFVDSNIFVTHGYPVFRRPPEFDRDSIG